MKIFELFPEYATDGMNIYRAVFPVVASKLWEVVGSGSDILAKWADGEESKPVGDFIKFPMYTFAGRRELVLEIAAKFAVGAAVQRLIIDGEDCEYMVLKPENYSASSAAMDHVFTQYPSRRGLLVTQAFINFWRAGGFIGASINEVGEMPDQYFKELA